MFAVRCVHNKFWIYWMNPKYLKLSLNIIIHPSIHVRLSCRGSSLHNRFPNHTAPYKPLVNLPAGGESTGTVYIYTIHLYLFIYVNVYCSGAAFISFFQLSRPLFPHVQTVILQSIHTFCVSAETHLTLIFPMLLLALAALFILRAPCYHTSTHADRRSSHENIYFKIYCITETVNSKRQKAVKNCTIRFSCWSHSPGRIKITSAWKSFRHGKKKSGEVRTYRTVLQSKKYRIKFFSTKKT